MATYIYSVCTLKTRLFHRATVPLRSAVSETTSYHCEGLAGPASKLPDDLYTLHCALSQVRLMGPISKRLLDLATL